MRKATLLLIASLIAMLCCSFAPLRTMAPETITGVT